MNVKSLLLFCLCCFTSSTVLATIVYDTWTSNEGSSGSYIFTVNHDQTNHLFNYEFTVDPWDAEGLGLFIDFGDQTMPGNTASDIGLRNVTPSGEVTLWNVDTTSNSCGGAGCNLNGLNPSLDAPDGEWELVFRLGSQGFDSIQTFTWTTDDFSLGLDDFGLVGIRAQQQCSGSNTLDNGDGGCSGSDKSYGSAGGVTPRNIIPEPTSLFVFGLGLIVLSMLGRRRQH
ncbi:hypothetical protein ACOMICROBIO_GDFFDHBD_04039 (plasmid) [Vibrio sp. B1REV9]|uniref:PEP-CTERM sorting domain-containing protein n=1 Tax=Vibrio sp. B1REV9 TaxID=2751179 RepID=UPI001AECECB4|nr:PEP-CTERM sorting domain-containing protein [Vibrio sp. B1REV9]CAE6957553.1 hypothetical protein ACOMICROBIO_GDFFDHBD_04039 [Vibrio sp. B1REV9]